MDNEETWPPLLSSGQMHQAVDTTLEWANRSLQRFDEMQGCVFQMRNHALMLRDFSERLIRAGQPHTFLCEDRQRLHHRLVQMNNTMEIAKLFINNTQRDTMVPLLEITQECDALEQECVQGIVHDSDEDNEVAIS